MSHVTKYLFKNFFTSFCSIFATLFLILSIVFFLQIARITSMIEINFAELLYIFALMLPKIIAFCAPITFFVALATSLYRLSRESESTVLFTLGYSPRRIARSFGALAVVFCAAMAANAAFLIPLCEAKSESFVAEKKSDFAPNFRAGEIGQSFGGYQIFVGSVGANGEYSGVALRSDEEFIVAKRAFFDAARGEFNLFDANVYQNEMFSWVGGANKNAAGGAAGGAGNGGAKSVANQNANQNERRGFLAHFERLVLAIGGTAGSAAGASADEYWAAAFGLKSFFGDGAAMAVLTSPLRTNLRGVADVKGAVAKVAGSTASADSGKSGGAGANSNLMGGANANSNLANANDVSASGLPRGTLNAGLNAQPSAATRNDERGVGTNSNLMNGAGANSNLANANGAITAATTPTAQTKTTQAQISQTKTAQTQTTISAATFAADHAAASNANLAALLQLGIPPANIAAISPHAQNSRAKDLAIFALLALFALASYRFAIAFGIVTYRYEKGIIYAGIFAVLLGYFAALITLARSPLLAVVVVFCATFAASSFYFGRKILTKY